MTEPTPNATLRAVRLGLLMSQDEFARAIREFGTRAGVPNDANKRLVQRWESGTTAAPRGHDLAAEPPISDAPAKQRAASPTPRGNHSGIWLSRYEYYSSGREETFTGLHYIVILQHGSRLTVRSLPRLADSQLTMDLTVDGNVITGTWVEQTASESYYRGARYHGAIQMLVEPTGRRMAGKWVGFGKEMDVNTGPWDLVFQDSSTNKATLATYDRRPPE